MLSVGCVRVARAFSAVGKARMPESDVSLQLARICTDNLPLSNVLNCTLPDSGDHTEPDLSKCSLVKEPQQEPEGQRYTLDVFIVARTHLTGSTEAKKLPAMSASSS